MNLIHLECHLRQNRDGASAGQVVSYLTLGTCLSPPVQTLRCVNDARPLQSDTHVKAVNGSHIKIQVSHSVRRRAHQDAAC